MSTVSVTRAIPEGVELVWQVFTDLAGRPGWLSTVESVELDDQVAFGTGTRWRETRRLMGGELVTEELVVAEVRPDTFCVITSPGVGAEYRMTYTFAAIEVGRLRGGTTVTTRLEGIPQTMTSRFLSFFFGGLAARTVEGALREDLDALASACADRAWTSAA
jgi:uncharacterized protein YndB with AHSA1/START domain